MILFHDIGNTGLNPIGCRFPYQEMIHIFPELDRIMQLVGILLQVVRSFGMTRKARKYAIAGVLFRMFESNTDQPDSLSAASIHVRGRLVNRLS